MPRTPRPSRSAAGGLAYLFDRLGLLASSSRRVDGMWLGCVWSERSDEALVRVETALRLIKTYDPLRYGRLVRDVQRIWINLLPAARGEFRDALKMCVLDQRYVLAETTTSEEIASTIVHEAAHARLIRCGIGYKPELRARVEAVCFRRQRTFATKLPDGEQIKMAAERSLTGFQPEFWSDETWQQRSERGIVETLRYLEQPEFVIRAVVGYRRLIWGAIRASQRIRSHLPLRPWGRRGPG